MNSISDIVYSEIEGLDEAGVSIYSIEQDVPKIVDEIERFIAETSTVRSFDSIVKYSTKDTRDSFINGQITAINAFLIIVSAVVSKKLIMLLNKDLRRCVKYMGQKEHMCILEAKIKYLKRQIIDTKKNRKTECAKSAGSKIDSDACSMIFAASLKKLERELSETEIKLAEMKLKMKKINITTGE